MTEFSSPHPPPIDQTWSTIVSLMQLFKFKHTVISSLISLFSSFLD